MSLKTCQERVGLFKEMSYLHMGGWSLPNINKCFNDAATQGLQMLPGGSKRIAGNQDGFFTKEFQRVLDGEAWASPFTTAKLLDRQIKGLGKNVGSRDWMPPEGSKDPNGKGTYYGTFIKNMAALDPVARRQMLVHEPPNAITNPGKKGVGWGYVNIALNPYPEHPPEPFAEQQRLDEIVKKKSRAKYLNGPLRLRNYPQEYFGPNPFLPYGAVGRTYNARRIPANPRVAFRPTGPAKWDGGCKDGCFSKFPEYMPDVYGLRVPYPKNVVNKDGKTYYPPMRAKSMRQESVINKNVARSIHEKSWKTKRNTVYNNVCASVGMC